MKLYWTSGLFAALLLFSACGGNESDSDADNVDTTNTTDTTTDVETGSTLPYSITFEINSAYSAAPAVHSYSIATGTSGEWLIIGGRKNGLHDFNGDGGSPDFPTDESNTDVYVYDPSDNSLSSMAASSFTDPNVAAIFTASNPQHVESDGMLYIAGGYYGSGDNLDSTLDIMVAINVDDLITAVKAGDNQSANSSVVSTQSDMTKATGGEMFILEDGNFYLAMGQEFNGSYNDYMSAAGFASGSTLDLDRLMKLQKYTSELRVFSVSTDPGSIAITPIGTYNMSGYTRNTSPMRRRDLNVVPNYNPSTGTIGLTAYSGVFTCPNPDTCTKDGPWTSAVYMDIASDGTPTITEDTGYEQQANVYATYNLQIYDPTGSTMYSNMLGGLGNDTVGNTDWTSRVSTLIRTFDSNAGTSNSTQMVWPEASSLPGLYGSEGQFIMTEGSNYLMSGSDEIMDLSTFPVGTEVTIGHCYGGITQTDAKNDVTAATNVVIDIKLTRNQ